jgi:cytochrome P450
MRAVAASTGDRALYLREMLSVADGLGDCGWYQRSDSQILLVNRPDLVHRLLVRDAEHFPKGPKQQSAFQSLLGNSVSLAEGDRHRRLRHMLLPVFARRSIQRQIRRMDSLLVRELDRWPEEGRIDLFDALHRLTIRSFGTWLLDEPEMWAEGSSFDQRRERIWRWIDRQVRQPSPASSMPSGPPEDDVLAVQSELEAAAKRRARADGTPKDVVQQLVNRFGDTSEYTMRLIRNQAIGLLLAAHETNACAVFWTIYLISTSSQAQPPGWPGQEREISAQLHEALLHYPPAGRQFRVASSACTFGTFDVPAGTQLTVLHPALHQKARKTTSVGVEPCGFIPFGAGPRRCIGAEYSMIEAHLLIRRLLERFSFEFTAPAIPELAVTLRPTGRQDVYIKRHERKKLPTA